MIDRLFLSLMLSIFIAVAPGMIRAHSPYFSADSESLDGPDGDKLDFKLLYGDGIFFADPVRAVITDLDGQLRAISPLSEAMQIHCSVRQGRRDCVAYDQLSGMIHESDPKTWRRGGPIFENDGLRKPAPSVYPEQMTEEYGFRSRRAGFTERLGLELAAIARSPRTILPAILWWSMILMLIVRPLYWIVRPAMRPSRRWYWWLGDLSLCGTAIAVLLGAGLWAYDISPTSDLFLGIALLAAAPLVFLITRQRVSRLSSL